MKEVVADLFASKKFTAALVAGVAQTLVRIAGHFGFSWLDPVTAGEIANGLVALGASYAVGQGFADHGKEAAQITADAKAPVVLTHEASHAPTEEAK